MTTTSHDPCKNCGIPIYRYGNFSEPIHVDGMYWCWHLHGVAEFVKASQ